MIKNNEKNISTNQELVEPCNIKIEKALLGCVHQPHDLHQV